MSRVLLYVGRFKCLVSVTTKCVLGTDRFFISQLPVQRQHTSWLQPGERSWMQLQHSGLRIMIWFSQGRWYDIKTLRSPETWKTLAVYIHGQPHNYFCTSGMDEFFSPHMFLRHTALHRMQTIPFTELSDTFYRSRFHVFLITGSQAFDVWRCLYCTAANWNRENLLTMAVETGFLSHP